MIKLDNVAYILMELVADDGKEALYDLIADHPGSTSFTAEQGRDALLVAVARVVQILAKGRGHLATECYDLAASDLRALTNQFGRLAKLVGRLAKLAAFLERSGKESLRAYAEGRPARPLDPFNFKRQS